MDIVLLVNFLLVFSAFCLLFAVLALAEPWIEKAISWWQRRRSR